MVESKGAAKRGPGKGAPAKTAPRGDAPAKRGSAPVQAIWKGAVSFGLVTIPVKVYSATQEKDIAFRQVHVADGGRIRYRRVCEIDGEEVPYSDIAKGHELPDGTMVVLTADDLADLPLPTKHTVEVLEFVGEDEIDPIYTSKAYYLQADGPGLKPYVLLREALLKTRQVAVVKVALRNRESLGMLRPLDGVLVLQTLLWPDEVRDSTFALPPEDVDVRPQEIAMAESYIETLATTFEPERYRDEYRAALEELLRAKSAGHDLRAVEAPGPAGEVVDLMTALQASVEAAKAQRAEHEAETAGGEAAEEVEEAGEERPKKQKRTRRSSTRKSA